MLAAGLAEEAAVAELIQPYARTRSISLRSIAFLPSRCPAMPVALQEIAATLEVA